MSWSFLNELQRELPAPPRRFAAMPSPPPADAAPGRCAPRPVADTIVISDIHLGSPVSTVKMLREVLLEWDFRNLVILGDLFDAHAFHRLRKHHWKLLGDLRRWSDPEEGRQIVWVAGNHDEEGTFLVAHMIGARVIDEHSHCEFEVGGRRYVALHGHQFDRFILANPVQTAIGSAIYLLVQRLEFLGRRRFSRWLKRQSKRWLHVANQIADSAARYGRRFGADYVLCGHTHLAQRVEFGDITYINTGCWTEYPSTLVAIDERGPRLVEYGGEAAAGAGAAAAESGEGAAVEPEPDVALA